MTETKQLLKEHILFSGIPDELVDRIISKSRIIKRKNGETLYSPHDQCRSMTFLLTGRLRMEKLLPNGKVVVLNNLEPGACLSEACAFLGKPYPVWVVAAGEVTVLNIPIETISELSGNNPFSAGLFMTLSQKLFRLQEKLELLSVSSAEQRVALYIMRLAGEDYEGEFSLPGTKTAIAGEMGLSRETVSRVFSAFLDRGILTDMGRGAYRIEDIEELSDILEDM